MPSPGMFAQSLLPAFSTISWLIHQSWIVKGNSRLLRQVLKSTALGYGFRGSGYCWSSLYFLNPNLTLLCTSSSLC